MNQLIHQLGMNQRDCIMQMIFQFLWLWLWMEAIFFLLYLFIFFLRKLLTNFIRNIELILRNMMIERIVKRITLKDVYLIHY